MLQCDRCVKETAGHVLKLSGSDGVEYHEWALCGDCLNLICKEAHAGVENYRPSWVRDFCPSLTPDQAKRVELYIASRAK